LEYFKKFPDAYTKVVASFDRTQTLYAYLVESGVLNNVSTILSIGSGDGEVELKLAKERKQQIGIVEPSSMFFDKFESNVRKAQVSESVLEAHCQSFQDYQPAKNYDLVLSLFSWFAFGFDRGLLTKALSCRTANGKLLICIQAEASPSTRISAMSRSSGINLTSEALSDWGTREGFKHTYDIYHGIVPAERYIAHGKLTQTGKDLVSFLAATPWDELPENIKSTGLESLLQNQDGNLIDFPCGCLIFGG
jgi:hypothetical protein